MDQSQELEKLKVTLVKVKKKYEIDVAQGNESEIEKDKRLMILLLDKIKEKKKQMELLSDVQAVSTKIKDDKNAQSKFFAKDSHRKSNKKIHFTTLLSTFLIFIYAIICTGQLYFYNRALYLQTHFSDDYPLAIYNTNYMGKFFGTLILVYFAIYAMNYKNMRYRKYILLSGFSGMILGILSYGGIGQMNKFIFSGKGFGIIPGIILLICCYFLSKNIITHKVKKVDSITKSRDFKSLDINPDEKRIQELRKKEEFTKKMKRERAIKAKRERDLKIKKRNEEIERKIKEDQRRRKLKEKKKREQIKKEQQELEKQMEEDIKNMEEKVNNNKTS